MNEERISILRMVAEGKITAEEAERLLEAIGSEERTKAPPRSPRSEQGERATEGGSRKGVFDFGNAFKGACGGKKGVFDFGNAFKGAFKEFDTFQKDFFKEGTFDFDTSPQTIPVSEGVRLIVKTESGTLTLLGREGSEIKIEGAAKHHYEIAQSEGEVTIKATRFDTSLTVYIPQAVGEVIARSSLGRVVVKDLPNDLKVDSDVGNVEMIGIASSNIQAKTDTGNISLDMDTITGGTVWLRSDVGKVQLRLPVTSAFEVYATVNDSGKVHTDLPLEIIEQGSGFLRGRLNGGGADIRLATDVGNISITARS